MEVDLNAVETSESNKSYYEPDYSKLGYRKGQRNKNLVQRGIRMLCLKILS
jgi:hypothetical protein